MAFHFGWRDKTTEYADQKGNAKHKRITEAEWRVAWNDFPWICMSLSIGAFTKTSVPIFVERLRINSYVEHIRTALFAAKCIDRRDPENIRKLALKYRRDQTIDPRKILEHWFLDRFEGWSVNVNTEQDGIWLKSLQKKFHSAPPKCPPEFESVVYRELREFYKEPEPETAEAS